MKKITMKLFLVSVLAASTGCSFHARGPEDYREDTRALLETQNPQIKQCYDTALAQNPDLSGNVVVHFTVAEETGAITDPQVMPQSTAPAELGQCIVNAINGLALKPPDERKGDATFVWDFQRS